MRNYTTQMDAARKGIVTPEIEIVDKKRKHDNRSTYETGCRRQGCNLCQQKSHQS